MGPLNDGEQGWIAVWLTAALGALGMAWKSWFGVRKDARTDRHESTVNASYEAIIRALRDELEKERTLRLKAEAEVYELRRKGGGK